MRATVEPHCCRKAILTGGPPCSVSLRWLTWPRSGWTRTGGPGAARRPRLVPTWTWMSSRNTCRSTRWRSSPHSCLRLLRKTWASWRIPTTTTGSQVSPARKTHGVTKIHVLKCVCVSPAVNSWSGQHPYRWHCGTHTPHEEYEDRAFRPEWPSQHDKQWVSSTARARKHKQQQV